MLRQTISTASKVVRSSAGLNIQRRALHARPSLIQATALNAARTVAPRARWYSAEAEKKEGEQPKNGEEAKPAETDSVEAQLRKQLEAKEAEVRDWKVRILFPPLSLISIKLTDPFSPSRTNASVRLPISATCRTAPHGK